MSRPLVVRCVGAVASLSLVGCEVPPLQVTPQPRREVIEAPAELPKVPRAEASAAEAARGFKVDVVVRDLIYPTSVEVDERGNLYVAEGGYVYGDHAAPARVWRFGGDGRAEVVADQLNGPVTDLLWHEGRLFISHKTKISTVGQDGRVVDLVDGLPSLGDHFNNQLAAGPDGKIYFGQGVATNSGVVGVDNFVFGWLGKHPKFHDVPARDIRVKDKTFVTLDPMVLTDKREPPLVRTAPFNAFGRGAQNERIEGQVKANGAVLRMNPDGSGLEVFAWGLRNPFGLAFTKDGRLFATDNGFDERGSRPIANAPDVVWHVKQDAWYGFPDFAGGEPVTDAKFKPKQGPSPEFIMEDHPPVEKPVARLPHQAGVTKAAAADGRMGLGDRLVVALFGDMSPITGQDKHVGREVVLVDPSTGQAERFFGARPDALGPKHLEHVQTAGPKRPVDVVFARSGEALYVVDMGAITVIPSATPAVQPFPGTGVVWRISREGSDARGPVDLSPLKGRGTAGAERSGQTPKENER